MGGGTIFKAIGKRDLESLPLLEADKATNERFEDAARPMLDERIELTFQNRHLAATRDLLLPRLVTGKLDVADLDLDSLLSPEDTA